MAGACPAVSALKLALETAIPFLKGTYTEWNGTTPLRLQVPGNPRHQMGVCLDVILFSDLSMSKDKTIDWASEKKLGENLVKAFVDLKADMQWTEIIFQDRLFWEPEYYKHYGGDRAHFTHIHIDWMANSLKELGKTEAEVLAGSPQKDNTSFSAALTARLNVLNTGFTAGTLAPINVATIPKSASADANPVGNWNVRVASWLWVYSFNADGTVTWSDPFNSMSGTGKWEISGAKIAFTWTGSTTTESWDVPLKQGPLKTGSTTIQNRLYEVNATRVVTP